MFWNALVSRLILSLQSIEYEEGSTFDNLIKFAVLAHLINFILRNSGLRMFLIITIPLTTTILPLHFVCFLFLCLQSVFYIYTASLKINYQVSSSLKRKKYIPTQKLQQTIYFGKSKIYLHSSKKKNQLCFNVPTTIVLLQLFCFFFLF